MAAVIAWNVGKTLSNALTIEGMGEAAKSIYRQLAYSPEQFEQLGPPKTEREAAGRLTAALMGAAGPMTIDEMSSAPFWQQALMAIPPSAYIAGAAPSAKAVREMADDVAKQAAKASRAGVAGLEKRVAESLAVPGRAEAGFAKLPKKAAPPVTPGVAKEPWQRTLQVDKENVIISPKGEIDEQSLRSWLTGGGRDIRGTATEAIEKSQATSNFLGVQLRSAYGEGRRAFDNRITEVLRSGGTLSEEEAKGALAILSGVSDISPEGYIRGLDTILRQVSGKSPLQKGTSIQGMEESILNLLRQPNANRVWQSTQKQVKGIIRQALSEGKPVPPEVLADYPDLAKAIPKAKAVVAPKVTLYRGEPIGVRPTTEGPVPFTPDLVVAQGWAGRKGRVVQITMTREEFDKLPFQKLPDQIATYRVPQEIYEKATPLAISKAEAVRPGGLETARVTGIPTMITKDMESRLKAMGVTETELRQMTPQQAWERLGGMPEAAPTIPPSLVEGPPPGVKVTKPAVTPTAEELTTFPKAAEITPPPPGGPSGPGLPPPGAPLDPKAVVAEWTAQIKAAKKLRGPTAKAISKERARRKAIIESQLQVRRGPEARQAAFGAAKGEIPTPTFEPASAVFSNEKAELLQEMIRAHFEKDAYRYLPAQTAFDTLFTGGRIPPPSELAVLEEVFGSDLIRSVLGQRAKGTKAWELFLEAWNVPKSLKASYDLSATLRQGAYLLFEGNPAKQALMAEFKAVRSEAGFKAVNEAIAANKWYEFSQGLGKDSLDLTLPRLARGIVGREEPYIGARLATRIPLIGKGVRISERAYTAFLNKIRMDTFAKEAEILSAKGAPREAFEKLAWNINVLSGRGSLGKFTQAAAILNVPLFSPRFAVSRFQLPLTLATTNPQLLKMALRDVVGYISSVFAFATLMDMAGVAEVEWNPLSSDFGKLRIGKTRIDPFAGFQQPVVLVAQLLAGKRKRLESGRMVKIDPAQRVGQFVESKQGPSASMALALKRGRLWGGKALTPANVLYELFMPIPVSDVWEAVTGGSGGLTDSIIEGGGYGSLGALGLGVQTFGLGVDWSEELKPYFSIPSNDREAKTGYMVEGVKKTQTRDEFLKAKPQIEAQLFILGERESFIMTKANLQGAAAKSKAVQLMRENNLKISDIRGLEEEKFESAEKKALRQYFERALGVAAPTPAPIPGIAPTPTPTSPGPGYEWYVDENGRGRYRIKPPPGYEEYVDKNGNINYRPIPTPTPTPAGVR